MTKLYKKAVIKFTAYKEFECPQDEDLLAQLKTFCDDHEIEFSTPILLDKRDECPMCGKFVSKVIEALSYTDVEIEGCKDCIDNWEPDHDDRDDLQDR